MKIDIINEKKKLKELLPNTKKENDIIPQPQIQPNLFEIKNYKKENRKEDIRKEDNRKEDIRKEDIRKEDDRKEYNKEFKKKEKVEDIFKYDKKTVEREFQTKYQKLQPQHTQQHTQQQYKHKNLKQQQIHNIHFNNRNNNNRNNNNRNNNNRNNNNNEIKIVNLEYPIDEEEIALPEKKVIVNENSNLTCEILIPDPSTVKQVHIIEEDIKQTELKSEREVEEKENYNSKLSVEQKVKRSKTMINHNRLKKKPFGKENDYYCYDKEKSPKQWNTINCEVNIESLPLHLRVKPAKMTQKKVKDFLVKEKITNPNKNLPEDLANFLYSSITSNDYQVNFVDIVNE